MNFIVDTQTLEDLNIFTRSRGGAVFNLFNKTNTRGGAQVLREMFQHPLSDRNMINRRSSIIQYFREKNIAFPFRNELFDAIEFYFSNTDDRTKLVAGEDTLQRKLRNYMGADTEYELLHKGIIAAIEVFNGLGDLLNGMDAEKAPPAWLPEVREIQKLLSDEQLVWMYREKGNKKLAFATTAMYDQVLRFAARVKMQKLLQYIYYIDVYISTAAVANTRGMSFAHALETEKNALRIEGMFHPQLTDPVAYTIQVDQNSNVVFLTGANMAGKSTFMKTLGITVLLAHMGFPVPAQRMEFSVRNGMFTTINLADNLDMGYSHFYAEVLRLKKVAEQVARTENIIVIFDELFRGTNVKDAYDATVAITLAFAERRNCIFVISTHIVEAGGPLKENCTNINFVCFPTVMEDNILRYTYQLSPGITNDRHGMMIINNERIIDILKSRKNTLKLV